LEPEKNVRLMSKTTMFGLRLHYCLIIILVCAALFVPSGLIVLAQDSIPAAPAVSLQPAPVSAQPPAPADSAPKGPITVLEDTLIRVRTIAPMNSKRVKDGAPVLFTLSDDVIVGDALAIPRGATVHGIVIESKKAGRLTGSPELALKLVSLDLGGRSYPLYTYQFKVKGTSKTGPTEKKVLTGAYVGALVGSVGTKPGTDAASRAANMGTVAAVGAGLGTLTSAAMPGPEIRIPSEAQVDFYLAAPITVTPVSAKEAERLAQGLHPGGPALYVRGDTP
jgi:hypothetical protein